MTSNKEIITKSEAAFIGTYTRFSTAMVKGAGCRLEDADGKSYLDFLSGIAVCSLGHCHPEVTKAICEQAKTLVHVSNLFHTIPQTELATGSPGTEDSELSETTWICYGWPASYNNTGNRCFVVNQTGDVLQTNNLNGATGTYSGTIGANSVVPPGDAAIVNTSVGDITGALSIAGAPFAANDTNTWLVLN